MTNSNTWHKRMLADLVVAGLAQRTQEVYLRAVRQLTEYDTGTLPEYLTEQQVKDYLPWMRTEKRAAPGTLKIVIGGLRFFDRQTCNLNWKVLERFRIPKELCGEPLTFHSFIRIRPPPLEWRGRNFGGTTLVLKPFNTTSATGPR